MKIEPQMKDVPPLQQAQRALRHTLGQISTRWPVAYYLGHGTQTLSLLVEALASIESQPISLVQENFPPASQPAFKGIIDDGELNRCPFCDGMDLHTAEDGFDQFNVTCNRCDAKGPMGDDEEEARDNWNKRVMPR